jgi:hypothetical protein
VVLYVHSCCLVIAWLMGAVVRWVDLAEVVVVVVALHFFEV